MAAPQVSVVIPVYNMAGYLDECLASVCGQTLASLEIICVDDGSTDDSPAVLARWAGADKRIKVVSQANQGLSAARNAGLDRATGRYIALLDADDTWALATAETVTGRAEKDGAEIAVYGGDGPPMGTWAQDCLAIPDAVSDDPRAALFGYRGARALINKFFRRSLVEDHHLRFDTTLPLGEDAAFMFTAFPHAGRISFCAGSFYHYRFRRDNSIITRYGQSRRIRAEHHLNLIEHVLEQWQEQGFIAGYEASLVSWLVELLYPDIPQLARAWRVEYAAQTQQLLNRYGLPTTGAGIPPTTEKELQSILRARGIVAKAWHRLRTNGLAATIKSQLLNRHRG